MDTVLPYIPVSYIDIGFDAYGCNLAVSQQFTSANNSDAFFEPAEGSIRTNKVRNLAITDAKIATLRANKIIGNIINVVGVGEDETIVLDGEDNSIKMYDDLGNLTVWFQGGDA